jgi:hypothetical protein
VAKMLFRPLCGRVFGIGLYAWALENKFAGRVVTSKEELLKLRGVRRRL